jgi:hypothetical protein
MAETWSVSGPKVIEVGGDGEPVRELRVVLVGGRVDVVAHEDDEARLEISDVRGQDLEVVWDDGVLVVRHPQVRWDNLLEGLRHLTRRDDSAEMSIAVPAGTQVQVGTVSADGLVAGVRAAASVRTVSGALVLDDVHGSIGIRTVSGQVDVRNQHGPLRGESVSGSVTVHAEALPELDLKTVSGGLAVDLHDESGKLSLKTVSGDVTVRIPLRAGYRFDAKSVSGRIVAEGRRVGGTTPGNRAGELREGDESIRISAKSVSGNITLLRTTAAGADGAEGADGATDVTS